MLAVSVDYKTKRGTIGTRKGQDVPREEVLTALESIGYQGDFSN